MYLAELNRQQKDLFLELSIHIATSDNDFCGEEKQLIKELCAEMNIAEKYDAEKSFEETITELTKDSSDREKRIIMLELTGVIMCDSKCTDGERQMLGKIADAFGIDRLEIDPFIEVVRELYNTYEKINALLNK